MNKSNHCQLLKIREAAERLSLSVRTVWRLIESGKLRAKKIGNSTRIKADDLTDFIDGS